MSSFNYPQQPAPTPYGMHSFEQLKQYAREFYAINREMMVDGRVPLGCDRVIVERKDMTPFAVSRDVLVKALEHYETGMLRVGFGEAIAIKVQRLDLPSLVVSLTHEKLLEIGAPPFSWKLPEANKPARVWPKVLEDMTDAQLADLCATLRQPFDLARAKAGHPLVTRDGRKARFVAHVPEVDARTRVLAVIDDAQAVAGFYEGGNIYSDGRDHGMDLFMAPAPRVVNVNIGGPVAPKRTVWVNTFKSPTPGGVVSMAFATKDAADSHGYNARSPFSSVAVETQQ